MGLKKEFVNTIFSVTHFLVYTLECMSKLFCVQVHSWLCDLHWPESPVAQLIQPVFGKLRSDGVFEQLCIVCIIINSF